MAEIERMMGEMPVGIGFEWTGLSYQEKQAGSQAPMLLALALVVVFLVLVALYESWSIPLSVLLIVPIGALGAVAAVMLAGMPNDVYFKVGLVTVIGLAAKNAILIIEFAKDLHAEGQTTGGSGHPGCAPAVSANRDDLARLHSGRGAAGARNRRGRNQPARHWYGRARRDVKCHPTRRAVRTSVLRLGHVQIQTEES